jgi:16S rRNA (uracil1498-N3)-methyltransferase
VSAPLFLVDALPDEDEYTLEGAEGHHAARVARMRAGETLVLCDGRGATAQGTVTAVGRATLTVLVGKRSYEPSPDPSLVVVQGIAKGDRGELAVQAMTEVGVDVVVPWSASRSVVRWSDERGERSRQRWVDTARQAAKQARRAWVPVVAHPGSTRDIAARLTTARLALVLHEAATMPLTAVDLPAGGDIVMVVGPEGGIAADELTAFEAAGGVPVRLGATVLRTSTAGPATIAVLNARLGRW